MSPQCALNTIEFQGIKDVVGNCQAEDASGYRAVKNIFPGAACSYCPCHDVLTGCNAGGVYYSIGVEVCIGDNLDVAGACPDCLRNLGPGYTSAHGIGYESVLTPDE